MTKRKSLEKFRNELKARKYVLVGFGRSTVARTYYIEAMHTACPTPLATLWFRAAGPHGIQITSMYSIPLARKCGLQGLFFKKLLAKYPNVTKVVTASDTRYSRQWLRDRGFKRDKNRDLVMER